MIKKLFVSAVLFAFMCVSASASINIDLKGGLVGSGGYGLGGSVSFPVFIQNLNCEVGIQYQSLKGYSGSFFPIFVNATYDTKLFGYPVYFGGGLNYLLSSAKQNNNDVQGGIGLQGFGGILYPLSDKINLLGEAGLSIYQTKFAGSSFGSSSLGYLSVGARFSMFGVPSISGKKSDMEIDEEIISDDYTIKTTTPKPVVAGTTFVSHIFKSYPSPKVVKVGKPIKIIVLPRGNNIKKCSVTFKNGKTLSLVKKKEKAGFVWKIQYKIPKTIKKGKNTANVNVIFIDNIRAKTAIKFEVK